MTSYLLLIDFFFLIQLARLKDCNGLYFAQTHARPLVRNVNDFIYTFFFKLYVLLLQAS